MKKVLCIIIVSLFGLIGYGQNTNIPISDSGYYYGVVNDSLMNKYIYMSFLSNDGDNILHIVPYINNGDIDTVFMHNNYSNIIEQQEDSIDGNLFLDNGWNIPGFDNYCYYTINNGKISFSLNIANIDKQYLDIFEFNGKIINNGMTIKSVINSTDSIFKQSVLILNYYNK